MKSFFTLGAIVALCQSVYSLNPGVYTIASANSDSLFLTDETPDQPLTFGPPDGGSSQDWKILPAPEENFILIQNHEFFINCHTTGNLVCFPSDEPQIFRPKFQGDNRYEFVEQGSGLFLRITKENGLELAKSDQSVDEQFSLVRLNG